MLCLHNVTKNPDIIHLAVPLKHKASFSGSKVAAQVTSILQIPANSKEEGIKKDSSLYFKDIYRNWTWHFSDRVFLLVKKRKKILRGHIAVTTAFSHPTVIGECCCHTQELSENVGKKRTMYLKTNKNSLKRPDPRQ